jgi:hypothetical protein
MKGTVLLFSVFIQFAALAQQRADTVIQGIPVLFDFHVAIYPESWAADPINGDGGSLEPSERQRSRKILRSALLKYPSALLSRNLQAVFVLKYMNFYKVGYGGTNSNDRVFITNNGEALGYSDRYIEQTFHHEFSSILYRNHPLLLDDEKWQASNPENFSYTDPENGVGAIRKNESSQDIDTGFCRRGFLTQYAMSGLENDINTIAQNLFSPAEDFWETVDNYPLIARKARLLISFYNKLDPIFTENYFRRQ